MVPATVKTATCELLTAIARVYRDAKHLTRDQGGTTTTTELCRAVLDALR